MKKHLVFSIILCAVTPFLNDSVNAQETTKVLLNTGVGTLKVPGQLGEVLKPGVSFNSGLEVTLKKKWFIHGEISLNTLGYNQQLQDQASNYLFTNTNTSLFQLDIVGGKDFVLKQDKLLLGFYGGPGYLNIGEPRLTLAADGKTISQEIVRTGNIFGKGGLRLSYLTKSPFFQQIYLDGSYFASSVVTQTHKLNGFSFFIGSKFAFK